MGKITCARITAGAARAILGLAFGAVMVAAGATPAGAHTALKSSNPKGGSEVSKAPEAIELTFTEAIRAPLTKVVVRGPDGEQFETGPPQVASDKVRQSLRTLEAAGEYEIVYRIVAADGHPLAGTVRFTLTPAQPSPGAGATAGSGSAPTTPPTQAATVNQSATQSDDVPPWVLAIAAVALMACVGGAVLFGRKVTRGLD